LPYIYGNTEYQAENYIGLDCADFVIAAYRKAGHDVPYTHVTGLYKYSNVIAKEKDVKITNDDFYHKGKPLFFGKDVKEGDLLMFADSHVGVLYEDKSDPKGKFRGKADGILNKYDIMIHVYFDNPKQESLGFCASFSVLRLK
jgi:cell wall-associated NlpC family hydrolase